MAEALPGGACRGMGKRIMLLQLLVLSAMTSVLAEGLNRRPYWMPDGSDRGLAHAVAQEDEALEKALQKRMRERDLQTRCSPYKIENPWCCGQELLICENLCFDGRSLVGVGNGDVPPCELGGEAVHGGPLEAQSCDNAERYKEWVDMTFREAEFGPLVMRESIGKKARWLPGSTFLQHLDQSTTNIAHWIGKVMLLLMVNNATVPALTCRVDRFVLARDYDTLDRMRFFGSEGFHAQTLHLLLFAALQPLLGSSLKYSQTFAAHKVLGEAPMAFGRVLFEPFLQAASENRPVCMERAVVPGSLKAMSFVGGSKAAEIFQKMAWKMLKVESGGSAFQTSKLRLLWIERKVSSLGRRRQMLPESKEALRKLLHSLNMEVVEIDFEGLTFKQQVQIVHDADIIIALHGAGLIPASSFAGPTTVVIEIMPYHVFHDWFYVQSASAGESYMMHMCHQGKVAEEDRKFQNLTTDECVFFNQSCQEYFTQFRPVELTDRDIEDLRGVLAVAAVVAKSSKLKDAAERRRAFEGLYVDACVSRRVERNCRTDLLRSSWHDPAASCVIKQDCNGNGNGN